MRRLSVHAACSLLLLVSVSTIAAAQEAVTITGHVSSASMPIQGASVRIDELDLGATTNADGRYSFIVPSSRVRGQTVTMTARYLRYRAESVRITLVGGSLEQDFVLRAAGADAPAAQPDRARADTVRPSPRGGRAVPTAPTTVATGPSAAGPTPSLRAPRALPALVVDSSAFIETAGATDLPGALAGRMAGLEVQSASTPGGTSTMQVRGPHTVIGTTQPLVVVNGIVFDNSNFALPSQRVGRGGFDYGSAINDLNLEDVASVQLLRGPAAAMAYGGRAANGVLLVTTRDARNLNGFAISASQQITAETALRLPEYQNVFGQGLGGVFSFFNGRGGGINDSVSQSWGPALLGQPIPQASLTEAGRAEVRPWIASPNSVSDYFDRGRTLATNVAAQGANESSQFRLSVANRSTNGLTPRSSLSRQSAVLSAGTQPSARLSLNGSLQYYRSHGQDRPGTGFDESNPVSVFSLMGRQVDVQALRDHLRDATGSQISWNYSGHNNPYFAPLENDNVDTRSRLVGGGTVSYALTSWLQATARAGADHYTDTRNVTVAPGWMGGFPYFAGRGSFATGGFENDDITVTHSNADVLLRAAPTATGPGTLAFTLGAGRWTDDLHFGNVGSDRTPANAVPPVDFQGGSNTNFVVGGIEGGWHDYATLDVTARQESGALLSRSVTSELYPSVIASLDLARANPDFMRGTLDMLKLRAGWSRSGNQASPALLQQLGVLQSAVPITLDDLIEPELTTGWEIGADSRFFDRRLSLDLTYYDERSDNLLFAVGSTAFARNGVMSNKGFEAQLGLVPLRLADGLEWRVGFNFAKNTNLVESLGATSIISPLGPSFGGVSVEARAGSSLAALVGTTYLRDPSGQLLLRNGRPLPDSITGPRVLGTTAASWTGGISSGLRVFGVDLNVLFDVRQGGRIFSATNRMGAVAGVLAETAFRPDTGLLIAGVDVATGAANTTHVTTEDYYHALAAIGERWVYDASFVKLREARATFDLPLHAIGLHAQRLRASVIGRNLAIWTNAPNIDPETVLSTASYRGAEMGQLPTTRSVGVQLSVTP
jgi:TonB-dependent SusC/RagA subfamily outer membrane receptor